VLKNVQESEHFLWTKANIYVHTTHTHTHTSHTKHTHTYNTHTTHTHLRGVAETVSQQSSSPLLAHPFQFLFSFNLSMFGSYLLLLALMLHKVNGSGFRV